MNTCYCCDEPLTKQNDHKEHIIQNAIGGKLSSYGILCRECGELLGFEIDIPFSKNFEFLSNLIDIKRDRAGKPSPFLSSVSIDGKEIKCMLKSGKLYPSDPYIDEACKKVYCSIETKRNLVNIYNECEYEYITELDIFKLKLDQPSNEEAFHRGLIKIAVEFALLKGIKIEHMEKSFNNTKKRFLTQNNIIPYYPLSKFEGVIESIRWSFENVPYHVCDGKTICNSVFPTNSIKLFSCANFLFCYINIFSVYENYVLLSDRYRGKEISEWYFESVCRLSSLPISYNLSSENPKDIMIASEHLNRSIESILYEIQAKKANGEEAIISKEEKPIYKKDMAHHYRCIANDILAALNYKRIDPDGSKFPNVQLYNKDIDECLNGIMGTGDEKFSELYGDATLLLYQVEEVEGDEESSCEIFSIDNYKTLFRNERGFHCTPLYIMSNLDMYTAMSKTYTKQRINTFIAASEILFSENED